MSRRSMAALEAGKHVLCEKPIGVSVEEVEELAAAVQRIGTAAAGRAHEAVRSGLQSAKALHRRRDGRDAGAEGLVLRLDPPLRDDRRGAAADRAERRPRKRRRAIRRPTCAATIMLAHGSHLVDTARYLGGEIVEVDARLSERFGAYCWFVDVAFANGALGHLDLTIPVRMDWHEGFQIYGENGSVIGKTYNPWLFPLERGRDLPRGDRDDHPRARRRRSFLPPPARGAWPMRCSTASR